MDNPDELTAAAPGATPAEPAAVSVPDPAVPAARRIEAWFAKHFHNLGPELSATLYNRIHAAKEELLTLFTDR